MAIYTVRYVAADNEIKQHELNKIQELFVKDVVDKHLFVVIEKSIAGVGSKTMTSECEITTLLSIWYTLLSRLVAEGNDFSTVCRKDCPFNIRIYETDKRPEVIYTLKAIDALTVYGPRTLRDRARKRSPEPLTTIPEYDEKENLETLEDTVPFMCGSENYIQQLSTNQRKFIDKAVGQQLLLFTCVLKFPNTTEHFIYTNATMTIPANEPARFKDIVAACVNNFFELAGKYNASVKELSDKIPFFFDNSTVEDSVENDYVVGLIVVGVRSHAEIVQILARTRLYRQRDEITDKLQKELKDIIRPCENIADVDYEYIEIMDTCLTKRQYEFVNDMRSKKRPVTIYQITCPCNNPSVVDSAYALNKYDDIRDCVLAFFRMAEKNDSIIEEVDNCLFVFRIVSIDSIGSGAEVTIGILPASKTATDFVEIMQKTQKKS